jgi:peptide/nickel transport system permease protein
MSVPGRPVARDVIGRLPVRGVMRSVARWLATAIPVLLFVSALTFVLEQLIPGDAARLILGMNGTPSQYAALRHQLGLDQPLWTQYGTWLAHAVTGNLGTSVTSGAPVAQILGQRIGATLSLIVGALLVATVAGVGLGVVSALRGGKLGRLVDVISLAGVAIPSYWLGLLLITLLAVKLPIFPATGYTPFGQSPTRWFESLVLPVLTLGLSGSSLLAKQTRDAVWNELTKDYVVALSARGLSRRSIIWRHVLRNAAGPVITVVGLLVIGLLSGTVLVETIFVLPGLGGLAVTATTSHDLPVLQGIALTFTAIVLITNLIVTLGHKWLDPRVRS